MKPFIKRQSHSALSRQKYRFQITSNVNTLDDWANALEILCEDLDFHELIAVHGIKVILNPDGHITFKNTGESQVDGPRYSRVMRALWNAYKPLFHDYNCQLYYKSHGELIAVD